MPIFLPLRRLWTLDKFAYSLRVFIAFSGALLFSGLMGDVALVIPLFLGIIACALSETDDSWQGRFQAPWLRWPVLLRRRLSFSGSFRGRGCLPLGWAFRLLR